MQLCANTRDLSKGAEIQGVLEPLPLDAEGQHCQ